MSILRFEDRTPRTIEGMIDYMDDERKKMDEVMKGEENVFGIGVNPHTAKEEMQFIRDLHHREDITHPYVQVILGFDKGIELDPIAVKEACVKIGERLIYDERQVLGAIHFQEEDNLDCHFMINYVGIDGSLYQQGHHVNYYKRLANEVLEEHGLPLIRMNGVSGSPPFKICV